MRMNWASVSFLKNDSVASEGKLLVGRWAMILSTSSVTGVCWVKNVAVMDCHSTLVAGRCQYSKNGIFEKRRLVCPTPENGLVLRAC